MQTSQAVLCSTSLSNEHILQSLRHRPRMIAACIPGKSSRVWAREQREEQSMPPKICVEPAQDRAYLARPFYGGGRRDSRDFYEGGRSYDNGRTDYYRYGGRRRVAQAGDGREAGAPDEGVAREEQPLSEVGVLLDRLLRMMVDVPDDVKTYEVSGSQSTVIEVRVSKFDHGKVVGRHGRTADALRDLLETLGSKHHRRFTLEILE